MRLVTCLLIVVAITSFGCKKDNKLQYEKDEETIKSYITAKGLNATRTESGLYVVVNEQGTGSKCYSTSSVKVSYKGYFTDGTVFDESDATGISFSLQQVIKGWTEGIPHFNEGGSGILLVPSALGYGESGTNGIPGNTVLIFDVKLIDVL